MFRSYFITLVHCFPFVIEAKRPLKKTSLILFLFHLFTRFMSMCIQNLLYLPVKMQMWPTGNNSPMKLAGWTDSLRLSRAFPTAMRAEPGESFSPGVPFPCHRPGLAGGVQLPPSVWPAGFMATLHRMTVLHAAGKNTVLTEEEWACPGPVAAATEGILTPWGPN